MDDDSDGDADSIPNLIVCNLKLRAWLCAEQHIAMLFVIFFTGEEKHKYVKAVIWYLDIIDIER